MSANPSPPLQTPTTPSLHTYHCLCATLLLCTPYSIPHLPTRAAPSRDKARILPLPPVQPQQHRPSPPPPPPPPPVAKINDPATDAAEEEDDNEEEGGNGEEQEEADGDGGREYLPSLILPALRPARKTIMVRREDGWERRRVWRCGRCGLGIGYEVEEEGGLEGKGKKLRVMFLLEGGLVETGDWDGRSESVEGGAVKGKAQGAS